MSPLDPDHEEHVREIAEKVAYDAVRGFGRRLLRELGDVPRRADGALNALDAYKAVETSVIRFERQELEL